MPVQDSELTNLVTAAEVWADSGNSITGNLAERQAMIEQAIVDAQGFVEGRMNRELLVKPYTDRPQGWMNEETPAAISGDVARFTYSRQLPIVQVTTAGVSSRGETALPQKLFIEDGATDLPQSVDYFAGWRGSHHVIEDPTENETLDLTTIDGLDTLTVLPPVIPPSLRRIISRITTIILVQELSGTQGGMVNVKQLGPMRVTSSRSDSAAIEKELDRIPTQFRRLNA